MRDTYKYVVLGIIAFAAIGAIFLLARQPSAPLPANNTSTPPPAPTSTVSASGNMLVTSPLPNESVLHDFIITGQARVFENQFAWRVLDPEGTVLASGSAYAYASDVGQFGAFEIPVRLPVSASFGTDRVTVEVFDYSAKDGSVIDLVRVSVTLSDAPATALKVYFNNSNLDPEGSCNKVFPVTRFVPRTQTPARAALEKLLQGPSATEAVQGYFTSINPGVKLRSLTIASGTARADFDPALDRDIGGSCRVSAIRAEITQTLRQFPSVQNVVISVNGRTEDILQP